MKKPKRKKSVTVTNFRKSRPKTGRKSGNCRLTDAQAIEIIERRYQIVQLRRDGYTQYEIAKALDISTATVSKELTTLLNDTLIQSQETVEQHRELQLERLDNLLKTYTVYATQTNQQERVDPVTGLKVIVSIPPNPIYANLILSIEARRAKLLALDVPETKKLEVSGIREYVGIDMEKI